MTKVVRYFLVLTIAAVVVFRGIFLGSIFWGDAPHFFPEEAAQFLHEPVAWTYLGNNFGGVNLPLWLYPLMFFWKFIPPQFLFLFPSIILSATGAWLLAKYLKFGVRAQFFAASVYTFNTYFLLLIDGGQMGVALSYGFFPFTLLFLKKFVESPKFKNFYLALGVLSLNGLADPRIALVAVATFIIWNINNIKKLLYLVPLGAFWILLNSFWIVPFILNRGGLSSLGTLDVSPVRFYDPFILFSPHYPDNLFDKINTPPVYFLLIPILVAGSFFISKKLKNLEFLLLYLFFSIVSIVPIGIVFRDSTKFYIPVMLFAGLLIGQTIEFVKNKWVAVLIFLYILFLIHPTVLGKMNFVLSGKVQSSAFLTIYKMLKDDPGFFRTAWISERHPMTFETGEKPGIDVKDLTKLIPFRSLNIGEDPLNFLNNKEFVDDFRTLGIKYVFLSGNPREVVKNDIEQKNWNSLTEAVDKTQGLEKVDWGVNFPVYRVPGAYPHFFAVDKLIGVVGSPISMKYPAIYFEDGNIDPGTLSEINHSSFVIFFNGKDRSDLTMSFLKRYFVFAKDAKASQWGVFDTTQYLKYKYQLLIRGINFTDLDYDGGIAFSSVKGERINFEFKVPDTGEYVLAYRVMTREDGGLKWKIENLGNLEKGVFDYTLTNNSDLEVLNAIALIPVNEFKKAEDLSNNFLNNFKTVSRKDLESLTEIRDLKYQTADTLKYKFDGLEKTGWIIFTDNFSPQWSARNAGHNLVHIPVYSMVNGFYVDKADSGFEIAYSGQNNLRTGVLLSMVTLATLIVVYFVHEKLLKRNSTN